MGRPQKRDITGERFGLLVTMWPAGYDVRRHIVWLCACECGKLRLTTQSELLRSHTRSCVCLQRKKLRERNRFSSPSLTHGESRRGKMTSEFRVWKLMIDRCNNVNRPDYKRYGGRGINVCPRWRRFEDFLADVGRRPSDQHTLERIYNNDGYDPLNCRWATYFEQANNTSWSHSSITSWDDVIRVLSDKLVHHEHQAMKLRMILADARRKVDTGAPFSFAANIARKLSAGLTGATVVS